MRVGYANLITSGRLVLVAYVAWLVSRPAVEAVAWTAVVVSTVAALLDIADGWVARRTRTETAFGARFDMEVDAVLVMVLAILAWGWGKAGAWVLLSGLMRYAFVAGGWLLPWLRSPLPPSLRRKTICVVQIVALIVVLGPIVRPPLSTLIAAAGLAILGYSFLVDTAWLWRNTRRSAGVMAFGSHQRSKRDLRANVRSD
jgi:phosphatidylglycerophosphate synthase